MQRINTVDSLYHDGNPATGELGTVVPAACLNAIQEEIAQAIEGFGGTVNPGIPNQLYQAISAAIAAALQLPVGTITPYGGAEAPAGWLLCNGQAVSRTNYAALFAVVGATFGPGDNVTTFNLPDLRGRMPIGAGQGAGLTDRVRGAKGGEERHLQTINEMPAHHHAIGAQATYKGITESGGAYFPAAPGANTTDVGGGQPFNVMNPFQVVNYIIKA